VRHVRHSCALARRSLSTASRTNIDRDCCRLCAASCKHYAEQFTRPKDAGTPIGANYLWIACHALIESGTLMTQNTSEFLRVGGLKVEDWVAPA
jgi:predicted nucleic acid-binding protein